MSSPGTSRILVDTTLYSNSYGHSPRPSVVGGWAFALDTNRYKTRDAEISIFYGSYRDCLGYAKAEAKYSVVVLP